YTGRLYNILSNTAYLFFSIYYYLDISKFLYPKVFLDILEDYVSYFYIYNIEPRLN
ncbi:hypothetical protein K504DRAFT_388899, partial [Pleomassaria siparia CBS 279.74]